MANSIESLSQSSLCATPALWVLSAVVPLILALATPLPSRAGGGPSEGVKPGVASIEGVTCECENSTCGPCEIETGTTFYSAKCGPANARVKSCKRPSCAAVENQQACLADLAALTAAGVVAVATPSQNPGADQTKDRAPASLPLVTSTSGEIVQVTGLATVLRRGGLKEAARLGLPVQAGDTIETKADSKVKVRLGDAVAPSASSELIVVENSRLALEDVTLEPAKNRRSVLLKLLSGKVRSRVNQKYDTPENVFRVRTRAAVAGVRGTDFVTSFEPGPRDWITEVRTLEGRVRLAAGEGTAQQVEIGRAETAAFVIKAPPGDATEEIVRDFVTKGYMTPIFHLSTEDLKILDQATEFKTHEVGPGREEGRGARSSSDSVCAMPNADFNQCSWSCEGNPAGEKRCRTDLPGVVCVRRLCRANGQWADQQRLPASQGSLCEPNRPVVRDCGAYW